MTSSEASSAVSSAPNVGLLRDSSPPVLEKDDLEKWVTCQTVQFSFLTPTKIAEFCAIQDPIHIVRLAIEEDSDHILRWLLARGVDVEYEIGSHSILCEALEKKRTNVPKLLLRRGADPNSQLSGFCSPLLHAVKHGIEEMVSILIEKKVDVEFRDEDGETPLHLTARSGSIKNTRLLLKAGAEPSAVSEYGTTPLHHAIVLGNVEIVSLLLDKGANVDANENDEGTPLHVAARFGSGEIARLLLGAKANPSAVANDGTTPLHNAVIKENVVILSLLLEKSANVDAKENNGESPLHKATRCGSDKIARLLLDAKADPSAVDLAGWTPLHDAILYGSSTVVSMLLQYGSDVNVKTAKSGDTPLHLAAQKGRWDIADELLKYGAFISAVNNKLETTVHAAVTQNSTEFLRQLVNYIKQNCVPYILNIRRGDDGFTALRKAINFGYPYQARILLEGGASFTQVSASGESDLDAALKSIQWEIRNLGEEFKQSMGWEGRLPLPGSQGYALNSLELGRSAEEVSLSHGHAVGQIAWAGVTSVSDSEPIL
ncbi:MAG: hypothetical protein Q9195_002485 [Heterodermia aff. obscurata]